MSTRLLFVCVALLVTDCVRAVDVGSHFNRLSADDVDVSEGAVALGKVDVGECALHCVLRGDSCIASVSTTSNDCYLRLRGPKNWRESSALGPVSVALRQGQEDADCTSANFPVSRGRSRYRLEKTGRTWEDANSFCTGLGGELAQLSTVSEINFVNGDLRSKYAESRPIIVGLMQIPGSLEPAGGWIWSKSRQAFNASEWSGGGPNNYGGVENYANLRTDGFNDIPGGILNPSLCECLVI